MSAVTDIIGGATSSSGPAPVQYNTWQPSNTNQLDTTFGTAVQNNMGAANKVAPYWQQYLSQLTTNPYQQGAQTAANAAGNAYTGIGNQSLANAQNMSNAGNQIYQTAMDPQQALYNRTYQQMMDQVNANQAARGITNSGYGADLANQASSNFNIDWQNNQLARQLQGAQGAGAAYGQAGTLGTGGAEALTAGGAQPLSTYNGGVSNLGQGLGTYGQGINTASQPGLADILSYLGLSAGQSNAQGNFNQQYWQNQMQQTQLQNDINNSMWGGVGQLGNMAMLGMGGFGGGGSFLGSPVMATSGPAAGSMVVPTFY